MGRESSNYQVYKGVEFVVADDDLSFCLSIHHILFQREFIVVKICVPCLTSFGSTCKIIYVFCAKC